MQTPVRVARPSTGWRFLGLSELWQYRELAFFLTWRDMKVRYSQTVIGVLWIVFQPVAMMLVLSLFLGRLAKIPSEGAPYEVFVLTGLVPWQLFTRSVFDCTNGLVAEQRLITRVYFPRVLVPISSILAATFDLAVWLILLVIFLVPFGISPSTRMLLLPTFVLLTIMTALGVGLWLSALNLEFRDIGHVVPLLTQVWMFSTPVVYPSSLVPEQWRLLFWLNPMTAAIEGIRWSLLGVTNAPTTLMLLSVGSSLAIFVSGVFWFRRRERTFVDAVGSGG